MVEPKGPEPVNSKSHSSRASLSGGGGREQAARATSLQEHNAAHATAAYAHKYETAAYTHTSTRQLHIHTRTRMRTSIKELLSIAIDKLHESVILFTGPDCTVTVSIGVLAHPLD